MGETEFNHEEAAKAIIEALDFAKKRKLVQSILPASYAKGYGDDYAAFIQRMAKERGMTASNIGITGQSLWVDLAHGA